MKILLASEYYYPHWTGIVKAFEALATKLVEENHEVTVLTTQFNKDLPRTETHNKTHIVRSAYLFKMSRTYYSFQLLRDAFKHIRKNDVLIINSPNSNILPLTIVAKIMGKKVFIFHQGDLILPKQTGNRIMNILLERLFDYMTIPAMALSDGVSTYTRDYAKSSRVMRYFMKKFHAYIPTLPIKPVMDPKPAQNPPHIGFAGRFVEEKGYDILFEAIPLIVKSIPNARFVFAGQTYMDYEPFFERNKSRIDSVKDHVEFLGLLDEQKLMKFYESLDVFIISSRSDCFPLTQMEAAILGIPIVVADIPGARMVVKNVHNGKVVSPENPRALAEGIIAVISDRKTYSGKGKDVIRFFKSHETFFLR